MQGYRVRQFQPETGTKLESTTVAVFRVKLNVLVTAKLLKRVAKNSIDFWGELPIAVYCMLFWKKNNTLTHISYFVSLF